MGSLAGVRVVDRTTEIAGPYCTKLLADAGAEVVKVEPHDGDPLRRWRSGALHTFLNASKRIVDEHDTPYDILVTDDPADLETPNGSVVVTITPFGCDGPWVGRPSSEFTLQAWAGATGSRGYPDGPPIAVGGRLGEWATGTYAGMATIAALRAARRDGRRVHVDVAMLDTIAVTMAMMPSIFASMSGWHPMVWTTRSIEVPSIEPTKDGYAVFTTNSAQQFSDFCVMIDHPELLEDKKIAMPGVRFARRDEFNALVREWTTARTTSEVLEQAALFRVPAGPTLNGETVTQFEQFVARGVFEDHGGFVAPRVPYRISPTPSPTGAHPHDENVTPVRTSRTGGKPLDGIRVLDLTAWWAGPAAGHALACLGADVVKVESITRPDLVRYAGGLRPPSEDQWWEWGPMYHGANGGKRGITLDLTRPEGITVLERLLESADLLIENYTPRVMENFGLTWDRVHEVNPRVVMVRMPAFGLDGPWRDNTGFAQTMESISGMAWVTGFPDGAPVLVRGACDPLAGMHAVTAALLALNQRDQTGDGCLVEATMVEAALNVAAEQVIEWSASGTLLGRNGNQGHDVALQDVYRCDGEDAWIAITCADDAQVDALHRVTGPDVAAHCATRDPAELAEELMAAGVPAGHVIPPRDVVHNPQLRHRGLFEMEHHPVTGDNELLAMPFRLDGEPAWSGRSSPTLGQHNAEILAEAGYTSDEIAALEADGLIGTRPVGA